MMTRRKSAKSFLTGQRQSDFAELSKTSPSNVLTDVSSETTPISRASTPQDTISVTTGNIQSNPRSSPEWPIFNGRDNSALKGLPFFRERKSNVVNFEQDLHTTWKLAFHGSEILSWKNEKEHRDAVNLVVIGCLGKANLVATVSEYDPAYRLELILERDTMMALQAIISDGPLKDVSNFYSPLRGRTATFSVKVKNLQKSDAPDIDVGDPFPFLFDGREMAKGRKTLLKNYPVDQLSDGDMLAVETNISSYDIPAKVDSLGRTGYSLSLLCVYFLGKGSLQSSPKNLKRQGDSLESPRKNKKAGEVAIFSDED